MTKKMNVVESGAAAPAVDGQLLAELVKRAQSDGVSLTGEGGLLAQVTKVLLESALEGEMDSHLGYAKHDAA
ncbi:MAG: Transposase for insertion sequence element, partial [Actinomycetia bacterium]|nr:Transposase for insertion sequence element [Actinomycetes bacterium]